ncbi:MAG: hypothetical protein ACD_29C00460G0002 [uncultured bacterium]|nr:MAG: hypothetical protein ACD_29C00460G0002 [uncultured bacterium]
MSVNIHQHKILIIDFGSQYAQLIARRVRELGVYCEIIDPDVSEKFILDFKPNGIILSGGPETVIHHATPRAPKFIFSFNIPLLGICYGMQTMAEQLGGKVMACEKKEFGLTECALNPHNPLFSNLEEHVSIVWMSHGDQVEKLPDDFSVIASTKNTPIAAMYNEEKKLYALQFHPEVTHTKLGEKILSNFVKLICQCESRWNSKNITEELVEKIRVQVGSQKVLVGLSGGVDSAVVAALVHKAIGDQLICVFVDTGLLRLHEGDAVMKIFAEHLHVKVIRVDAEAIFLEKLAGISDPEAKRKMIGKTFIDVFNVEAIKLKDIKFLGQGTIYSDVIESAKTKSGKAHVIKSHHNVGGLPEDMQFTLIEPLRELFKDEVRKLGLDLGLPNHLIYRHPFPGVGLAVRILGEIKKEFITILQHADAIFIEALREENLYNAVSQAFAVFLPIKSVGVKGDARCYEYVIALRCVTTVDFMTAEWSELPHAFLARVSNKILNEVTHVSRVVYDISGKPPATIEWE